MKTIKVIGPAHPYRGGLATYNERLTHEFMSSGFDVEIETFTVQYPSFLFPGKSQYSGNPFPEGLKIKRTVNSVNPFNWIKTGRRISKEKPDMVVIRYWLPFMAPCFGTIAWLIRKNKHSKIICLADNIVPHEHHPGDRVLTNYFMQQIDGLVAMSQSVLNDANTFRKDLPQALCPHPLFDNYGKKLSFEVAKQRLKLDTNIHYLLFFGFIRDYKGLDLLLNAFADERLRRFPVKLLIAGEYYSSPEPYLELIRANQLENLIELRTEFIADEEVNLYFCAADMVVQPYKSATQSGVTQIAYHFEKPMLVTDVGGLAEIVPHQKVGYITQIDSDDVANCLADFFENNREEEFSKNVAIEKEKFGWDKMIDAIEELIKS